MANSHFQKVKVQTPIPPNKGGTGVGNLNDKGVLIGNGTNNVTTVAPGAGGDILISDGTNWISGLGAIGDQKVSYEKLDGDLVDVVAVGGTDIDWTLGAIFTKTLSGNTTLTFSNYQLDKNIILKIDGDYSLTLPNNVIIIDGEYIGQVINYISLHCTNADSGNEEVWGIINQKTG